ncbi:dTDP-glucose 4,6-dehydratase [Brevundimonas sp.]|uniref:dTDP-glucose 4,6-dehydratase n=1 Tax=Brevundimonas sp. TaxID=1871086 RepID=UPI0025DC19E5|nr:dTDP-glucose 4,6-dehydratase [Brevundimonas sp.]
MRALVTGGAGFIGSAVVRALLARGDQVTVVDAMTYAANPMTLAAFEGRDGFDLIVGDIFDPETVARAFEAARPDAVLHLAAESHVDRSIDGPAAFVRTNVVGTQVMLDAALTWWRSQGEPEGFRFLHVSTDEVFGDLGPDGAFSEASPYRPRSPYAASKAGADHLARAWRETYGLPVILTNCSNNFGPYQHPEKLIPLMILKGARGEPLPVYGDGLQVRDWLHVDDHAEGLLLALERGRPGATYLFGARQERTNRQVVEAICALLDQRRPDGAPHASLITRVEDRPGHDRRYAVDPSRAESGLGWRPRHDFESGLAETVDWYLSNPAWCEASIAAGGLARRGTGR